MFYRLDLDNWLDGVSGAEPFKTLKAPLPPGSLLYAWTLEADMCITCHTAGITESGKQVLAAIYAMGPRAAPAVEHQTVLPIHDVTDTSSGNLMKMVTQYFPKDRSLCWAMTNSDKSLTVGSWRVTAEGRSHSLSVISEPQVLQRDALNLPPPDLKQSTTLILAEDSLPTFLQANKHTYLLWSPEPRSLFVFSRSHTRRNTFVSVLSQSAFTKGMTRRGMQLLQTDNGTCSVYAACLAHSATDKRRYVINRLRFVS